MSTMETIVSIPLNQLRESPFNPRKAFNEDELRELARSIAALGVMQPIVVRKLDEEQRHIEHTHEIVFGHRRFRGSRMADLDEIPCIVRVMSDREAAIAQAHENVKRADITPFEEADQFARLMADYGMTAEEVGDEVDMSKGYVYSRLKLHNAAPAVRAAHTEEGLSTEIAIELARIVSHKRQTAELKSMRTPEGAWLSVRAAKSMLRSRAIIDLVEAPFDLGDGELLPSAGTCHSCNKCSVNDPDMQREPGTWCADVDCYQEKCSAKLRRVLDELAAQGHRVIEGDEARQYMPHAWATPRGFTRLTNAGYHDGTKHHSYLDLMERTPEDAKPRMTIIALGSELTQFLQDEDLVAWHAALGFAPEQDDDDDSAGSNPLVVNHHPGRPVPPALQLARSRDTWRGLLMQAMLTLLARPRTTDELRWLASREYAFADEFGLAGEALGIDTHIEAARTAFNASPASEEEDHDDQACVDLWLKNSTADTLGALLAGIAFEGKFDYAGRSLEDAEEALALLERYGVDVAAALRPFQPVIEAAPTPSPAAQAIETAAKPNATNAKKPAARYKNQATGETWNGRGLMPKWLKVATAAGAKLSDFEQPSDQAGSAGKEKGGAAGAEASQVDEEGAAA